MQGRAAEGAESEAGPAAPRRSLLADYGVFLRHYKAWYLVPILAALAVLAVLVATRGSDVSPFVYEL